MAIFYVYTYVPVFIWSFPGTKAFESFIDCVSAQIGHYHPPDWQQLFEQYRLHCQTAVGGHDRRLASKHAGTIVMITPQDVPTARQVVHLPTLPMAAPMVPPSPSKQLSPRAPEFIPRGRSTIPFHLAETGAIQELEVIQKSEARVELEVTVGSAVVEGLELIKDSEVKGDSSVHTENDEPNRIHEHVGLVPDFPPTGQLYARSQTTISDATSDCGAHAGNGGIEMMDEHVDSRRPRSWPGAYPKSLSALVASLCYRTTRDHEDNDSETVASGDQSGNDIPNEMVLREHGPGKVSSIRAKVDKSFWRDNTIKNEPPSDGMVELLQGSTSATPSDGRFGAVGKGRPILNRLA